MKKSPKKVTKSDLAVLEKEFRELSKVHNKLNKEMEAAELKIRKELWKKEDELDNKMQVLLDKNDKASLALEKKTDKDLRDLANSKRGKAFKESKKRIAKFSARIDELVVQLAVKDKQVEATVAPPAVITETSPTSPSVPMK
jgi:hypothetical protein